MNNKYLSLEILNWLLTLHLDDHVLVKLRCFWQYDVSKSWLGCWKNNINALSDLVMYHAHSTRLQIGLGTSLVIFRETWTLSRCVNMLRLLVLLLYLLRKLLSCCQYIRWVCWLIIEVEGIVVIKVNALFVRLLFLIMRALNVGVVASTSTADVWVR